MHYVTLVLNQAGTQRPKILKENERCVPRNTLHSENWAQKYLNLKKTEEGNPSQG